MTAWPAVQRAVAALALVVLSPALLVLSIAIRSTSAGPALHRAVRFGSGTTFTLYKLRTMWAGSEARGPAVTASADPRITRLGRILRRTKLDELPQLWNVVRGEMLLVGPRPEDPRYVDLENPLHRLVFSATPGITSPAALAYRNEELVLFEAAATLAIGEGRSRATSHDVDVAYRTVILPAKLQLDAEYLAHRSIGRDLRLIGATAMRILGSRGVDLPKNVGSAGR
jgi:lipopolysaccharide/colanic/teichoic acid biosynthesis glycosyltransferase